MNNINSNPNKDLDTKITFILTLYKDNTYTERFLKYFNTIQSNSVLLIGDGKRSQAVKNLIATYNNSNIKYFEFDDNTPQDYFYKLKYLLEKVETPYVMLCDNDDLFIVENIRKCIQFLDQNNDYAACGGLLFFFNIGKGYRKFKFYCPKNHSFSLNSKIPFERVSSYLQNYHTACWYHVHRKETISIAINEFIKTGINDLLLMELFLAMATASQGKILFNANYIHYLRQLNSSQVNITIKSFASRVVLNNLGNEIAIFIQALHALITKNLSKKSGIIHAHKPLEKIRTLTVNYLEKAIIKVDCPKEICLLRKIVIKIGDKFKNLFLYPNYLKLLNFFRREGANLNDINDIQKKIKLIAAHCEAFEKND